MLISGLCAYYDILAEAGKVLPNGYSNVNIHYILALTEAGGIDEIIDCRESIETKNRKGKTQVKYKPTVMLMPKRSEKPSICSNIIEHRPVYIFGLNFDKGELTQEDKTNKARKSHEDFVATNLAFIEELHSPLIDAYRKFLEKWEPDQEIMNDKLLAIGKDYDKSGYAFCLTGYPDRLLQNEPQIRQKWEESFHKDREAGDNAVRAQCAVSGRRDVIAKTHNKIKGVAGGQPSGTVLVGVKNEAGESYGNTQSYNSNISETMMQKYTEALNYLLASPRHRVFMDELTVIFWAMNSEENCEAALLRMLYGGTDVMDTGETEEMLYHLLRDTGQLAISRERLVNTDMFDPDVDFYIVGVKPNASRLSIKFIYRKKFGEILWNAARFQEDIHMEDAPGLVYMGRIRYELVSPKSTKEKVNPALLSKLMESVLRGGKYPEQLLETVVRRTKTDCSQGKPNYVSAGLIKACLNRNDKEGLKVALDKENTNQAYLCGRFFAVLEKLQMDASDNKLNRTIKDAYFASASSKPVLVFPKLITLAQHHLAKSKNKVYYNKLIGEITNQINGTFPDSLPLKEQGNFIIGYYQQYQSFFTGKSKESKDEREER